MLWQALKAMPKKEVAEAALHSVLGCGACPSAAAASQMLPRLH